MFEQLSAIIARSRMSLRSEARGVACLQAPLCLLSSPSIRHCPPPPSPTRTDVPGGPPPDGGAGQRQDRKRGIAHGAAAGAAAGHIQVGGGYGGDDGCVCMHLRCWLHAAARRCISPRLDRNRPLPQRHQERRDAPHRHAAHRAGPFRRPGHACGAGVHRHARAGERQGASIGVWGLIGGSMGCVAPTFDLHLTRLPDPPPSSPTHSPTARPRPAACGAAGLRRWGA
jgi:hypothetical protein